MEQTELLEKALEDGGIPVYQGLIKKFFLYQDILIDWNKKVNLISRRDESRIIARHFLESLGLVKTVDFPSCSRIMDVGTGAGFPGIPVKLVRPDLRVILVESKRKKVLFLKHMIEKLDLEGIDVVLGRVEEVGDSVGLLDFIVSRSVTDLVTLIKWCGNCWQKRGGRFVVIKGPSLAEELAQLKNVSTDLNVTGFQVLKYDPFPSIFKLDESFLVVVEMF